MVQLKVRATRSVRQVLANSAYSVVVHGAIGAQLVLLVVTGAGTQLLAPAPYHRGYLDAEDERVPGGTERFAFSGASVEYRFVAIEIEAGATAPIPPAAGDAVPLVADAALENLASWLGSHLTRWRWDEHAAYVVKVHPG